MRIQDIFLAALEIDDSQERTAYVLAECGDDLELRNQVTALLIAHEKSGEFLDVPVLQQIAGEQEAQITINGLPESREEPDLSFLTPGSRPGFLGRLLHYEVECVLGSGGFGVVLKAFDEKLHRVVAIKTMLVELAATSPARKRFLREARAAAAIRHENVITTYAVEEKPIPFLVMEFIDGSTLQDKLNEEGPFEVREVVRIGRRIAAGLEAAHSCGLIHRDIKPANILLEKGTGCPKITDFGLARSADDASLTRSGAISGTPLYMSPEQAQGLEVNHQSDLFSLGSVLYVMCSGRPPFRASNPIAVLRRVVEDQPRSLREIVPEVPHWLAAIISRLHAKNASDRFSTAKEVAKLLKSCETALMQNKVIGSSIRNDITKDPGRTLPSFTSPFSKKRGIPGRWIHWMILPLAITAIVIIIQTGRNLVVPSPKRATTRESLEAAMPVVVSNGSMDPTPAVDSSTKDADRQAAEYVLSIGGKVIVDNDNRHLTSITELPAGPFHLTEVNLMSNQKLTPDGLKIFRGTTHLITLDLTMAAGVDDSAIANFCNNMNLKYLGLAWSSVTGAGLKAISGCRELAVLFLNSAPLIRDDDLAVVATFPGITCLGLSECDITDAGIAHLADNPTLVQIDLRWTNVSDETLKLARTWPRLMFFDVESPKITDLGTSYLMKCRELVTLNLDGAAITDKSLTMLASNPGFRTLKLRRTPVSGEGVKKLSSQIPDCQIEWNGGIWKGGGEEKHYDANYQAAQRILSVGGSLRVKGNDRDLRKGYMIPPYPFVISAVSLSGCRGATDALVDVFGGCREIRFLSLSNTLISDAGLANFRQCHGLQSLDISGSKVVGPGLANFAECPNLELLSLWFTPISLEHVLPLADKPFTSLNFGGNSEVSDEWFPHFTALDDLGFLNLRYTNISDEGLAPLRKCHKLNYLSLGKTRITDAGLVIFQDCEHLKELILSETAVTDAGLDLFQKCGTLKNIELLETKVTASGIERLKQAHPGCRILWNGGTIEPQPAD